MKNILVTFCSLLCTYAAIAQSAETEEQKENKWFAGGGFGVQFGSYTLLNLSPQIGYRFNKYVAAGSGINLLYARQKEKDAAGNDFRKVVQGITGINFFGRFYPKQTFFAQVQPEVNYLFGKQTFYQPQEERFNLNTEIVPSVLVGGGLAIPSQRGYFITTILYDILQEPSSPYRGRPVVNVGYNFSL